MEISKEKLARQLYDLALELVEAGRSELAETTYQMALELDPNDFQSINNLAVIIDKSGRIEQAEDLYLKAASHPFYDSIAMFNLGYLYWRTDRPELAELWYRRAIAADPYNTEAMVNLAGLVQEQYKDLSEGKHLLELVTRIDSQDAIAIFELANIYRQTGDTFLAELFYRKAIEVEPSNALANYNLAAFLVEIDRSEEANQFFDTAYSLDTEGKLKRGNP